jgi:hypothetical protein
MNRAIQVYEFNNFDDLNLEFRHNILWIQEGEKILRRKKLYNDMQKMFSSKTENSIVVYWNDVYLNSVVKFHMKTVEQVNK